MTELKFDEEATKKLAETPNEPAANTSLGHYRCFVRGEWKAFLESPADVARAVRYVEANPVREGLPRQRWPFVTPFDPTL